MKIVIFPAVDDRRFTRIAAAAGSMTALNCDSEETALSEIVEADAFFGKLTPPLLRVAKKLRWVQSPTASLEHYIFRELVEHPCILTNMRGLFSDVIADHVFGYILCFARNLHVYLRQQGDAHWAPVGGEEERPTFVTGPGVESALDRAHIHLSDCTIGVVGLGNIGSEVARRGIAFSMRVLAVDPVQSQVPDGVESVWRIDRLDDLLAQSDFVVIAAPHTPQTAGMFRREQFQMMRPSAYLINIGRGAIVALGDLCDALDAGEIAGAGLDVFETEPLPADHRLWKKENVIITPHVAACSVRIPQRHLEVLLDNIRRFVAGEPLRHVADKETWF